MNKIRVTQLFPFLLPVRVMQRKICFMPECTLMGTATQKPSKPLLSSPLL